MEQEVTTHENQIKNTIQDIPHAEKKEELTWALTEKYKDLHLSNRIVKLTGGKSWTKEVTIPTEWLEIQPGEFFLGAITERIHIPQGYYGDIWGRATLSRLGIEVNSSIKTIQSGYSGHISLEINNISNKPIRIYSGMKFMQITFHKIGEK